MGRRIFLCLTIIAICPIDSQGKSYFAADGMPMIRRPKYPEDLPEAEPLHPGHTLLRPSRNTLKSAAKFPLRSSSNFVYGNTDNLGITYGKTSDRVMYSDFRKHDMILNSVLDALGKTNKNGNVKTSPLIIMGPFAMKRNHLSKNIVSLNDGNDKREDDFDVRRHAKKVKGSRGGKCSDEETSSGDSSESDVETNPGNPYTVIRSKYHQNFMWNYDMDGNHMNINPNAPEFNHMGPDAADLFYGRKWWYFNQDDYVPLG